MEYKKKKGFFNTVARVVTGKTAEQRSKEAQEKKHTMMLEQQAYLQERDRQAPRIGQAKAKIQAQQRIKALSQPKPKTGLLNLGDFGKTQAGFDPLTFGASSGAFGSKAKQPKVPSPMDVANMHFKDYTKKPSPAKAKVKAKIKRKRRRKKKK